jgi:hypothetical protein
MMTKNHTTTTALVVLAVAATLLAAGTIAIVSNHSAFAWKHKEKEKYNKENNYNMRYDKSSTDGNSRGGQAIVLSNDQSQESECQRSGNTSPIDSLTPIPTGACNNTATATNTNNGGNTAKTD